MDSRARRVLIVEDDPDMLDEACGALQAAGYLVVGRATLAGARQALSTQTVDAIVLDLRLPDGNASELLGELAARGANIPVVVASGTVEVPMIAKKHGVRYLRKPFHVGLLLTLLSLAIDQHTVPRLH